MKYRVKEFNSIYDPYFGEGKGWILITNELEFWDCLIIIAILKVLFDSKLNYEIIPIINNQLVA